MSKHQEIPACHFLPYSKVKYVFNLLRLIYIVYINLKNDVNKNVLFSFQFLVLIYKNAYQSLTWLL